MNWVDSAQRVIAGFASAPGWKHLLCEHIEESDLLEEAAAVNARGELLDVPRGRKPFGRAC